ncbi:MAG TPA: flippase-like domain-containing protein [Candidatus Udaeobacter sp.]|nr:flippase-like domain-containing protein [Candidatus Udaeobacter sp.]
MKRLGKLHITVWLLGLAGAALFTGLLIRQGIGQVWDAFATAKWVILGIVLYHSIPLFFDAVGWGVLFPKPDRPRCFQLFWTRWIGESVSTLVPSAAVGGDIVRARLIAINGTPLPLAAGSVLVDITLGIFIQAGFTLVGLFLLVEETGKTSFIGPTLVGVVIALFAFAGFYFVQRLGIFRFLARVISRLAGSSEWQSLVEGGDTLDRTVRSLYARRSGVVGCCIWTMLSLVVSSGEIWLALWALNLHASFIYALILQSTVLTIRSAAFAVPAGLGVQEGGYLVVGTLLGIPGDGAFALSLIARAREIGIGVPGLITWQFIEARRLLRVRARLAANAR